MKKFDYDKLKKLLHNIDWNCIKHADINLLRLNLKTKLIDVCNEICPFKTIKTRKNIHLGIIQR